MSRLVGGGGGKLIQFISGREEPDRIRSGGRFQAGYNLERL